MKHEIRNDCLIKIFGENFLDFKKRIKIFHVILEKIERIDFLKKLIFGDYFL